MSASDDIRILQKQVYDLQTSFSAPITNSLGADVALNNTTLYFDGPSVAQGTVGTWFVSGSVSIGDNAGLGASSVIYVKLWDGTTVIASGVYIIAQNGNAPIISLSGYISNPAANLRISARDSTTAGGYFRANSSGIGKDSTITAFRIG
jgi:hypothetical protein